METRKQDCSQIPSQHTPLKPLAPIRPGDAVIRKSLILLFVLLFTLCFSSISNAQKPTANGPSPGYNLIAPLGATDTYLVNMRGKVVHKWPSKYQPGNSVYLLQDGSLLRSCKEGSRRFQSRGGVGGRVQRIAWDGELLWDFPFSDNQYCQHHDIEPMPNGNVLLVAWEYKTRDEAIQAGRDPNKLSGDSLWPETIVEVKPNGKTGGEIVWQWHLWDHVVQSFDKSKDNFGHPGDHPELVDINFMRRGNGDWIHMNSVAYNAELDQIAMSARWFDEVWVIDHGTTKKKLPAMPEENAARAAICFIAGETLLLMWPGFLMTKSCSHNMTCDGSQSLIPVEETFWRSAMVAKEQRNRFRRSWNSSRP